MKPSLNGLGGVPPVLGGKLGDGLQDNRKADLIASYRISGADKIWNSGVPKLIIEDIQTYKGRVLRSGILRILALKTDLKNRLVRNE